jgi:hypothetical protein
MSNVSCIALCNVNFSAALTAKLLLTLPGTNGEPAWQEFKLNSILSGQQGPQPRCDFMMKMFRGINI